MKKMVIFLMTFILITNVFADEALGDKVAVIKISKGVAVVINKAGNKATATKGLWVTEGSTIKTENKSFVRLSFIDKSVVNVGPNSEMKIEKFSKNEAGVLNVISGKIRSKVSKNYLDMDKESSKLYVRDKNAVMGVRGTDFVFSYSPITQNSTAILFEGEIVFNKLNKENRNLSLEQIVNRGHIIRPGQFSVSRSDMIKVTRPAKLSHSQLKNMEKNQNFLLDTDENKPKMLKSIVPPGLTGDVVMNDHKALEKEIKSVVKTQVQSNKKELTKKQIFKTKGYNVGDDIRPADGSLVDINSGTIIPVPMDATFDKTHGQWVSNSIGGSDQSGNYIPPQGYKITEEGKLIKLVEGGLLREVILEIKPVDEVPPLGKMHTVEFKEQINGPAPAGQIVPSQGSGQYLPPPPIPTGNTFMPPSYYTTNPNGLNLQNAPKTPVKIKVNNGN